LYETTTDQALTDAAAAGIYAGQTLRVHSPGGSTWRPCKDYKS